MTEKIHLHTYDHGLVLIAEPMPWLESAAFSLLLPAGAVHDPPERAGLASLTCEMALRGAGPYNSRELIERLDNLGVERSESVGDAHTSFSGATLAESLFPALEVFAEVVLRPHLPADQLDAGRQVALQEVLSVDDDPPQKLMETLRARHYPAPWGRPSHGDVAGLESIVLGEIAAHVERRYQPQGAILGVAGKFDWPALQAHVERLFAGWQPRDGNLPAADAPGEGQSEHLESDTNQTQIGVAYSSVPYRHPDYFQAWGAVGALSGGMSARLFTEVREKRGLCYSVHAAYHTLRDQGAVFAYAGTTAARAQETLDVLVGELVRLAEGIEPHEIQRLKARIKSALIMQQESSASRSSMLARDWYHLGRPRSLDEVGALVDALTCESINAYLAAHPPRDFTVVTLGPEPLEVPSGVC